ncbi:hypothetical protein AMS59_01665 [Lysinibacillus sp. FJAT-14745]|uniref:DUF6138 family protein n=1 Tax=Lysinibacillus sp. FJAT-14745 TaxID=1704289 RepID=UPI0006ABB64B|nr:DUF6138 family protein [Lysinibacillus sp. FJAT-14745]KOP80143.1 hypothetical protein AMS59_01665 [Lysinibacillus sp. FJAT-14745]
MNQAVEAFLNKVWKEITTLYEQESKRINEFKDQRSLQGGVHNYLRVTWKKGKFSWSKGKIHISFYRPSYLSSYKFEADTYIMELTDELLAEEFFPALCGLVNGLFHSEELGPRFFDYKFEVVFEFEWESSKLTLNKQLFNEPKLIQLKKTLDHFIQTMILSDLPVLPEENDIFFFAYHLVNPDLMQQEVEVIDPLIRRLTDKLNNNQELKNGLITRYTSGLKKWASDYFLLQYFDRSGDYGMIWTLKEDHPSVDAKEIDFFLYAALQIGFTEPDIPQKYMELAVQLGSKKAADYLKIGSGKFVRTYRGELIEGRNNDITQTIEIRILSEEELAYKEALDYIINLLKQEFPKSYQLKLESSQKNFLPVEELAKSELHQFFTNALGYPNLFPKIAEYVNTAMEEFAWYGDVEPSEESVMPGTYAALGLGLYSEAYFPLVCRYMELVDTEHQSAQDGYMEAFIETHGVKAELMPVIVSILLGGTDEGTLVKNLTIDTPELAEALYKALKGKEIYEYEMVLCRIFGSIEELEDVAQKAQPPLKEGLEQLLALQIEMT